MFATRTLFGTKGGSKLTRATREREAPADGIDG